METKICTKCGTGHWMTLRSINVGPSGRGSWCKPCHNDLGKEARVRDPEGIKNYWRRYRKENESGMRAYRREYLLSHNYGLSLEDYQKKFDQQDGVCLICKQPETRQQHGRIDPLSVDHNHITGTIRDLLCYRCNQIIGRINEDIEIAKGILDYLLKWEGK